VEERSGRGALVLALTLCYTGDPAREARYGTYIETFQVFAPHLPYALWEKADSLKARGERGKLYGKQSFLTDK
jgi:hypothetical protein